ncbi:M28 family peptidase [Hymenobacter setariae]|uniref:M28 family peptidase n=1 Tax=Hymenobacter setariae TaxID=2594794 RepID=A0A558BPC4_9BACT|nr:M28 family peptidase [Hymenobacter setariae]TVT38352.1 M28 family peptidase [Hymenobacter setariae]
MSKPLYLATALLLASAAVAQPTVPTPAGATKVKTKHKRGQADAATTTAPMAAGAASATDYSLPYAASITPEGLKTDLDVLASDAYEGRETGKKGQKMAADYIAKAFAADGLAGPVQGSDNPYLQHFTMNRVSIDPASAIQVGGKTYTQGKDFYVLLPGGLIGSTAPLKPTFAGYGIKEANYSDATPAPGGDLVVLLGQPLNKTGQPLLGATSAYGASGLPALTARTGALRAARPKSVFLVAPTAAAFAQTPKDYAQLLGQEQLEFTDQPTQGGLGIVLVSPALGAALLGTTPAGLTKYEKGVTAAGKPIAGEFKPASTNVQLKQKKEPFTTENVLGYLEGGDKKDEVVVVSAHYDHLGIKDGVVYNGADDDGSGTVSVLAMARAFTQAKKDGHGPRRSILFLANVGEEEGLLGSQYYTDHPIFPLANTVTDLNIDMVGRVDSLHQGKGDYLYLVGADRLSTELNTLSEATNQQYQPIALDYKYNAPDDPEHIYERSDHYNFAKHNVPIIFYTSGLHPQYHKATDDVALIDFPAMARRDQLIFHTAWAVANRDQRILVDEKFRATGFVPSATDLDRYVGTYASAQIPLKVTFTKDGTTLKAQATGQPAFALEPVSQGIFKFDQAQIRVEFDPAKPSFTLKQGGGSFVFTKE